MFVQTNIRYCKFTNSNKHFCGRSNRASTSKLLTRYQKKTKRNKTKAIKPNKPQISIQKIHIYILDPSVIIAHLTVTT